MTDLVGVCEFAQTAANLPGISAGTRIATSRGGCPAPRNDMQKEGRVRGCKDVARNAMQKADAVSGCKDVARNAMQKTARRL